MKSRMVYFPERGQARMGEIEVNVPAAGEVLVRNLGCGVCQAEIKEFLGLFGHSYPLTRLGHEGVGRVIEVGEGVEGFAVGDLVSTLWQPAFWEFNAVRADWACVLPESAAANPALWLSEPVACALNGIIAADVQPGQRVLLLGAGYMGLLLVQLLRRTLAREVVVCDLEETKLLLAREMGTITMLNAREVSLADYVRETGGFDVVIEATGAPDMIKQAAGALNLRGRLVVFADHSHHTETLPWEPFMTNCATVVFSNPLLQSDFPALWRTAIELMLAGHIDQAPLISHRMPAEQCQQLMEVACSRSVDYVKGYLSW